ncbi:MAG: tetratricopeptide repeat protein [Caldilineaceae bacterium]
MSSVQELAAQLNQPMPARERVDLINDLVWALERQEMERSRQWLQEAQTLATTGEFTAAPYALGLARCAINLARVEHFQGHYEVALAHGLEAVARCEQINDLRNLARALDITGITYVRLGNHAEALPCLLRGLTLAVQQGDKEQEAYSYNTLAILYVNLGDHQKGAFYFEQSLALARALGNLNNQAIMLSNLCMSYKDLGDYPKALEHGLAGLELAKQVQNIPVQMWALSNLGNTYAAQANFEQALEYYRQAVDLAEGGGDAFDQAYTLLSVARACFKQNQFEVAHAYAELVLDIAEKSKQQGFQFEAHEVLAAIAKEQGNFVAALAHYERFHQIKEQIFNQEADDRLKRLEVAYQTEAAKREAEIYQLRYVELQREISERERVQKALIQAQKLESLGILAGGVAHDFNNLLVSIMGQTGLAARKLADEHPIQRHLDKVREAAGRAATLALQMLAYSGRGNVQIVHKRLNELLVENSQLLRSAIGEQVQLHFSLAEDLPLVEIDPGQLYQVLINLALNAAEAEASRIRIRTQRKTLDPLHRPDESLYWQYTAQPLPAGDYVALVVEDNGKGMDAATQEKLFDPFFSTKFTGRGLGLAAVLGIVRGHKGGITVQSQPGRGSTFQVLFPVAASLETVHPSQGQAATPLPAPLRQTVQHVLVIDDQIDVCETITAILNQVQILTHEFADGQAGIQYYQQHYQEIDAVLLDLTMPGLNGIQTARELHKIYAKTPIILMSGFTTLDIAKNLGETLPFLQKPFTAETLLNTLQQVQPNPC